MLARAGHQRDLQRLQTRIGSVHRIAHPQAEIGRHLVVAAACGMQASRCRTDQFGQTAFGGHVDVFQVPVFRNPVRLVLGGNLIQPPRDQRGIIA